MTAKLVISEHDQLGGLSDDDHPNYLYLPGRAGGQVAIGGTLTTQTLAFQDNAADAQEMTWGPGLNAEKAGVGTTFTYSAITNTVTLQDVGAGFTLDLVGRRVIIAGATSPGNNGTFIVTSRPSVNQIVYYNATGVSEAFPGTWTFERNAALDLKTGNHDLNVRHIGVGSNYALGNSAGNGHVLLGSEIFGGTGNKVGIGMFPAYVMNVAGTGNLYGVQGNVFFGGDQWTGVSNINSLQFYPAPDYQYGSTVWGNTNLNLIGITTGGCINLLTRTISCNALLGIQVQSLAHIFGGPGAVSANRATAIEVTTPSQSTGTIAVQTGIEIQPQLYGVVNQGLWLSGDNAGADIVLGGGKDARIYYNTANLVIDPDVVGSGIVLIGATGDDDMRLNAIEIDGALNHDGSTAGFFNTAPVTQPTALTAALTQITHTGPTTPDYAIATPINTNAWGFSTQDEFETAMSVILNLQTRVDELESKIQSLGLLA